MFYNNARKLCVVVSLSLLSILTSGCGMWRDFTTYFNTYYNAKTLFNRTEEDILKQKRDIFLFRDDVTNTSSGNSRIGSSNQNQQNNSLQNNSSFGNQSNTSITNTQFENESSSQFTSQINNTLNNQSSFGSSTSSSSSSSSLSTGQVKQDLTKVIEKCSKILQYEQESSYFADALFMTGKAFYYQQEYARAQRKFQELAGLGETKYSLENNLWLAKTYLQLRGFDEGLKLIEDVKADALKKGEDDLFIDASITKISFFIFREEFSEAIKECKNFLEKSPDDETSALVSYQLGKIYLQMKDNVNALEAFSSVLKYSPTFDVEFNSRIEHARLLKTLKRLDESFEEVEKLRTTGRYRNYLNEILVELGQVYYEKSDIEEAIDVFKDVDSTYVGKRPTAIGDLKLGEIYEKKFRDYDSTYKYYVKSVSLLEDKDIQAQTNNKLKIIDKYRQLKLSFADNYQLLAYAEDSTLFLKDSSDYDFAYKEYLDENKRLIEQQGNSGQGGLRDAQNQQMQLQQQAQAQTLQKKLGKKKDSELTAVQRITLGRMKKPSKPKISADSIKTIISADLYTMGNLFFSELEVPDSTVFYFSKILREYPTKPIAVQTMYALGTFYETSKDTVKADSLFQYIYDNYEKSSIRTAVMQKLGMIKKNEKDIKTDIDPATTMYEEAEKKYYDKKYNEAIEIFSKIANEYPLSVYVPKSIYFTGLIYEKDLKMYDSAAVTYGRLTSQFEKDPLVALVSGKVQAYRDEKDRIKKEAEEKIKKEADEKKKKEEEEKAKTAAVQNSLKDDVKTENPVSEQKQNDLPVNPDQKVAPTSDVVKDSVKTDPALQLNKTEQKDIKRKALPDSTKTRPEL